jgi:Sulfotransferase domain
VATGRSGWSERLGGVPGAAVGGLRAAIQAAVPRGTARGRLFEAIREARSHHPKTTRPGQDLRVLVVGPPKTGNVWIKCLLAHVYGLRWLDYAGPDERSPASLARWVERGGFAPGTIFHRHYAYSPELVATVRGAHGHLVTMVRDPYDLFVSSYYHLQKRPSFLQRAGERQAEVIGKPLDHPDVLRYLERGFQRTLRRAVDWVESGDSVVVRYEDLHRDPVGELARVTDLIRPADRGEIERAVEACRAETMRSMSRTLAQHVRAATVGDSQQRLGPAHLAIFRERHAELVRALGYEVR